MNAAALLLPLLIAVEPDRGPVVVSPSEATWRTGGPASGSVRQIWIDPDDSATLYALAETSISRSNDGGRHWVDTMKGIATPTTVTDLAMAPKVAGLLYAATETGVYKSTDGAETWTALGLATPPCVLTVTIDPKQSSTLYVLTCSTQLFRSDDGGIAWTPIGLPNDLNTVTAHLVISSDSLRTLYLGLQTGVLRSSDGGQTWSLVGGNLFQTVLQVVIDPSTPTTIYAVTLLGIFRSEDRGDTWVQRGSGEAMTLVIDPNTKTLYAGTTGGVWKSFDEGEHWQPTGSGFASCQSVQALAVDPGDPTKLYAGTDVAGLFESSSAGGAWRSMSIGLPGLAVVGLAVDPAAGGSVYAATLPHPQFFSSVSVYRSEDAGSRWAEACLLETGSGELNSLVVDPSREATLYAGVGQCITGVFCSGALLRSGNGGASWQDLLDTGNVTAVGIDPQSPENIYLGVATATYAGFGLIPISEMFKSVDGGQDWRIVGNGLPSIQLSTIQVDPSASSI